jgi:hypothetical protein
MPSFIAPPLRMKFYSNRLRVLSIMMAQGSGLRPPSLSLLMHQDDHLVREMRRVSYPQPSPHWPSEVFMSRWSYSGGHVRVSDGK